MALIDLYTNSRESFLEMGIRQIVAMAGDGTLRDGAASSSELRQFLSIVPTRYLTRYVDDCLDSRFECSGFILQDIVNELGRRLGYRAENGPYRTDRNSGGNAPGFHGLWKIDSDRDVVVKLRTDDYHDVCLDRVFEGKQALEAAGRISGGAMVLVVVGRGDSNGLEIRIRHSRHALDARLVNVESLASLVLIKEKAQDGLTLEKIRVSIEAVQ